MLVRAVSFAPIRGFAIGRLAVVRRAFACSVVVVRMVAVPYSSRTCLLRSVRNSVVVVVVGKAAFGRISVLVVVDIPCCNFVFVALVS